MTVWIVERRSGTEPTIEGSDCHVAASLEGAVSWMARNKDYEPDRTKRWWWVVLAAEVGSDSAPLIVAAFDWNGRALSGLMDTRKVRR